MCWRRAVAAVRADPRVGRAAPATRDLRPATPTTAYERRERLRNRRAELVASLSRLTREPHSAIHSRLNRATGARSVSAATADQLERANELLVGELRRAA
jgi:hypothetical protein